MEVEPLPGPILELVLHHFSIAINTRAKPDTPSGRKGYMEGLLSKLDTSEFFDSFIQDIIDQRRGNMPASRYLYSHPKFYAEFMPYKPDNIDIEDLVTPL